MFIEIFCNVLIGNLDRSVLNYLLYMAEIIERVEWQENDDAKIFFGIIYPFCDVKLLVRFLVYTVAQKIKSLYISAY